MTGAPCIFGKVPQGPRQHPDQPCRPRWQSHLPAEWRGKTVVPQSFRVYREYEVPARRVVGRDRLGEPCFCACDYRLIELRSEDDDDLYPALTYGESLDAWRLLDGRWLVHRRLQPYGDEGDLVAALSLEERMPR
ncbi:hypothetical protein [Lamprocystis purpurea]|jgi:hypothetical protein|uniref:hypothetical protein n=1 Tax=Lamprocystis purpurea TaxID=61598 RepID=UPI00058C842D|nr:hypothetical protein [Lamprocystis purpurea]